MSALASLDKSLEGVFKGAPKLSESARETLARWVPWLSLIGGLLSAWAVYALWQWAHLASGLADYANELSRAFGGGEVVSDRLTVGIWLGMGVLAVEAVIYLLAFGQTKDRKKSGWNLLFYGVLLNAVYGLVLLFTDYGSVGNFIGYLVGTVIGLYFLYQIKSKFTQ